jgi:protein-tyrosine phosphatase
MKNLITPLVVVATLIVSCAEEVRNDNKEEAKSTELKPEVLQDTIVGMKPKVIVENSYALYPFQLGDNIIAMSPLPGKVNLAEDIQTIQAAGITKMVTLVSQEELEAKGLSDYFAMMEDAGIEVYHSPVVDYGLPRKAQVDSIINFMELQKDGNENVLIHCMGGYGRSGTIMGCYAKVVLEDSNPIQFVRNVRGAEAIETKEQEEFVKTFND